MSHAILDCAYGKVYGFKSYVSNMSCKVIFVVFIFYKSFCWVQFFCLFVSISFHPFEVAGEIWSKASHPVMLPTYGCQFSTHFNLSLSKQIGKCWNARKWYPCVISALGGCAMKQPSGLTEACFIDNQVHVEICVQWDFEFCEAKVSENGS